MALSAGCHIEIRNGGSDTICSGAFDPTRTAGMYTDGAATSANTSAPVFSSASYNFVAGDVGAYVFIGAGTNWTKGWYVIASVASNVATLTATASGYQAHGDSVNTSDGCASVASPTGATWSIDYSQQAAAEFTCSDGTAAGAGSTLSSATIGFGKQMVGNAVRITAGTNCTTGHHVITSVAAGVATFNNAVTTGATADCTLYLGGAAASPGYGTSVMVAGNCAWLKYNAASYDVSVDTYSIANGKPSLVAGSTTATVQFRGYNTYRGDNGTRPTIKATAGTVSTGMFRVSGYCHVVNVIFDANSKNVWLSHQTAGYHHFINCKFINSAAVLSFNSTSPWLFDLCEFTANAGGAVAILSPQGRELYINKCHFHDNTNTSGCIVGTSGARWWIYDSVFASNSGPGVDLNTTASGNSCFIKGCTFYANTGAGVRIRTTGHVRAVVTDCIFANNTTYGIHADSNAGNEMHLLLNNAFYNNTSGAMSNVAWISTTLYGNVTLSADPFANATTDDFRANVTTGGGALLRSAALELPGLGAVDCRDIGAAQHGGIGSGMGGGFNG